MFQSVILQMHRNGLLHPLNEIAIAIEQSRDTGQNVIVSSLDFFEVQKSYVNVGQDDQLGIVLTRLEKLRVQFDGKIMQLLLGKGCVLDFLLSLFRRIGEVFGRVIAAARLQAQPLWALY